MESTTKRLNEATPSDWDKARQAYIKSLDEAIIEEEAQDIVNKPAHYNNGDIECIDYIKQQLGDDFGAYLEGNIIKYLHRYKYKNGQQDLKKAQWYLDRLLRYEMFDE